MQACSMQRETSKAITITTKIIMIKIEKDLFKLTRNQAKQLRKACKIAKLDFIAMAARPKDALQLIQDVQNREGITL